TRRARRQAMPRATPTGQRLGRGECVCESPLGAATLGGIQPICSSLCQRRNKCCFVGGYPDAVLTPPPVDERPDLVAHEDLVRPRARALVRPLVCRVDPDLAPVELPRRGVVEGVERPLRQQHVTAWIGVGADAEED